MPIRRLLVSLIAVLAAPTPARPEQVTLTTGEVLQATIVETTPQAVTLNHPVLGRLTIQADHIRSIEPQAQASEQPPAETPAAAEAPPDPPLADVAPDESPARRRAFFKDWKSRLELGLSGAEGNTESTNLRLAFNSERKDGRDEWSFKSTYYYAKSRGETTRNELNADLTKRWLLPKSPWFIFAQGIYDYDEFDPWEQRLGGFGGVGYDVVKTDRLEINSRIGGGVTKEFRGERELRPEGLISAAVVKWNLTDCQTVSGYATFYPDLAELDQYRVVSKLEWLMKISRSDGLSLKVGVEDEYESHTAGNAEHNDLKYYGTLVLEF